MPPGSGGLLGYIVEGINALSARTSQPFLDSGFQMLHALIVFRLTIFGMYAMRYRSLDGVMSGLADLVVKIGICMLLMTFYVTPAPASLGGMTFPDLIVNQMIWMTQQLDAGMIQSAADHLQELLAKFMQPGWLNFAAILNYLVLFIGVVAGTVLALMQVALPMIGVAVLKLLGPFFIPFILVPGFDRWFHGWFSFLVENAMTPVVAVAFLNVMEVVIFNFVTVTPDVITEDAYPIYMVTGLAVVISFDYAMWKVGSFTAAIFRGGSGGSSDALLASLLGTR